MRHLFSFAEKPIENFTPATSAIAAELNISRATAYRYLVEMNDRGMVEYDGQEIHTASADLLRKL